MSRFFLTGAALAAGLIGLPLTATAAEAPAQSQTQSSQTSTSQPPTTQQPSAAAPAQGAAPSNSNFSDAQLRNFAQASVEIDRIKQQTQSNGATPDSAAQMRSVLQQHQLNAADYNNIVAALQTNPALAQRVATLRAEAGATATQ
ncbi:MAG TPA: DUF4168 domain-containing protein [Caulobacterales bacterium]|nr:DUF4168 domain-containing protein [Caulobacterales bacterium]